MSGPTIVIVDDDPTAGAFIRHACAELDRAVTVYTVTHEQKLLTLLQRESSQIQVVVLDVHMGGSDGRWLCTRIQHVVPHAQIVPFTADRTAIVHLRELGCFTPLVKPVLNPADVVTVLQAALDAGPPRRSRNRLAEFLAAEAPRVLRLLRQRQPAVPVGIVTGSAVLHAGIAQLVQRAGHTVVNTETDDLPWLLAQSTLEVLLCTPDMLRPAQRYAEAALVPVLVYVPLVTPDTVNLVADEQVSIVMEPVQAETFGAIVREVGSGQVYRSAMCRVLSLTPRQRQILQRVQAQQSIATIATELDLSESHVRHLLTTLYRTLGVTGLPALREWVQAVPATFLTRASPHGGTGTYAES